MAFSVVGAPATPRSGPAHRHWRALLVAWTAAVALGYAALANYAQSAGPRPAPPQEWPVGTRIPSVQSRPALLLFLHPRCPCSAATLEEFQRVLVRIQDRADATILFLRPDGTPPGWEQTSLWRSAETIPAVRLAVDVGGSEARRFGAATSGTTLVYDGTGTLLFRGGITAGRGHSGDNTGRAAVVSAVMTGLAQAETPIFGCALFHDSR